MAVIYEIDSGTIVSESSGMTTIKNHDQLPEYGVALQRIESTQTTAKPGPATNT